MYTAHSTQYPPILDNLVKDVVVCRNVCLAALIYDIVNYWGSLPDPESVLIRENGTEIGTACFSPWTCDSRNVYFTFPKQPNVHQTYTLSLEESTIMMGTVPV